MRHTCRTLLRHTRLTLRHSVCVRSRNRALRRVRAYRRLRASARAESLRHGSVHRCACRGVGHFRFVFFAFHFRNNLFDAVVRFGFHNQNNRHQECQKQQRYAESNHPFDCGVTGFVHFDMNGHVVVEKQIFGKGFAVDFEFPFAGAFVVFVLFTAHDIGPNAVFVGRGAVVVGESARAEPLDCNLRDSIAEPCGCAHRFQTADGIGGCGNADLDRFGVGGGVCESAFCRLEHGHDRAVILNVGQNESSFRADRNVVLNPIFEFVIVALRVCGHRNGAALDNLLRAVFHVAVGRVVDGNIHGVSGFRDDCLTAAGNFVHNRRNGNISGNGDRKRGGCGFVVAAVHLPACKFITFFCGKGEGNGVAEVVLGLHRRAGNFAARNRFDVDFEGFFNCPCLQNDVGSDGEVVVNVSADFRAGGHVVPAFEFIAGFGFGVDADGVAVIIEFFFSSDRLDTLARSERNGVGCRLRFGGHEHCHQSVVRAGDGVNVGGVFDGFGALIGGNLPMAESVAGVCRRNHGDFVAYVKLAVGVSCLDGAVFGVVGLQARHNRTSSDINGDARKLGDVVKFDEIDVVIFVAHSFHPLREVGRREFGEIQAVVRGNLDVNGNFASVFDVHAVRISGGSLVIDGIDVSVAHARREVFVHRNAPQADVVCVNGRNGILSENVFINHEAFTRAVNVDVFPEVDVFFKRARAEIGNRHAVFRGQPALEFGAAQMERDVDFFAQLAVQRVGGRHFCVGAVQSVAVHKVVAVEALGGKAQRVLHFFKRDAEVFAVGFRLNGADVGVAFLDDGFISVERGGLEEHRAALDDYGVGFAFFPDERVAYAADFVLLYAVDSGYDRKFVVCGDFEGAAL